MIRLTKKGSTVSEGYSGTPLVKKLGIKPGYRVYFHRPPEDYSQTLGPLPDGTVVCAAREAGMDLIQCFCKSRREFFELLPELQKMIYPAGMLWVSWPKKASKVPTDLDENVIREIILTAGLVDVKVCAVDAIWSGLKCVYA